MKQEARGYFADDSLELPYWSKRLRESLGPFKFLLRASVKWNDNTDDITDDVV